jgi:hypothetical protein
VSVLFQEQICGFGCKFLMNFSIECTDKPDGGMRLTQNSVIVENFGDRQARLFDVEIEQQSINVQEDSVGGFARRHFAFHVRRDTLCGAR